MTSRNNLNDDAALVLPQCAREGRFGQRRRADWNGGTGDNSGRSGCSVVAETTLRQGRKVRAAAGWTYVCRIRSSAGFSTGEMLLRLRIKWTVSLRREALYLVGMLRRRRISVILSNIMDKTWNSMKMLSKRRQRASSMDWLADSRSHMSIPPDRTVTRTPRKGGIPHRRGRRSLATLSRQVAPERKWARWRVLVVLKVGRMRCRDRTHGEVPAKVSKLTVSGREDRTCRPTCLSPFTPSLRGRRGSTRPFSTSPEDSTTTQLSCCRD